MLPPERVLRVRVVSPFERRVLGMVERRGVERAAELVVAAYRLRFRDAVAPR